MEKRSFLLLILISGIYIFIGTYNYFNNGVISYFFNNLRTDLDYTIIRPSEVFGVMTRFVGSYIYDSDVFFILGQLLGLVIYTCFLWLLGILLNESLKKMKSQMSSRV